jgi:hypothetical protein
MTDNSYSKEQYEAMARACGYEYGIIAGAFKIKSNDPLAATCGTYGCEKNAWIEWHPDTDPGDCFRMQEAIMEKHSGFIFDVLRCENKWIIAIKDEGVAAHGDTLQEAWCNLAIAIGDSPNDT